MDYSPPTGSRELKETQDIISDDHTSGTIGRVFQSFLKNNNNNLPAIKKRH